MLKKYYCYFLFVGFNCKSKKKNLLSFHLRTADYHLNVLAATSQLEGVFYLTCWIKVQAENGHKN